MDTSNLDLKDFNEACEDFLTGKYILAELKITTILEHINQSEKIKNIISSCVENYNFAIEFKRMIDANQHIELPDNPKGIIAFCFSLLYNIDCKSINFFDFLHAYFDYTDLNALNAYRAFSKTIIYPFKEAINTVYAKTHILVDTDDYQNNIYNRLKRICVLVLDNIEQYRLKEIYQEELEILINAMKDACVRNDKETVYALLVGVDYFSLNHKKTKIIYEQFKECFSIEN